MKTKPTFKIVQSRKVWRGKIPSVTIRMLPISMPDYIHNLSPQSPERQKWFWSEVFPKMSKSQAIEMFSKIRAKLPLTPTANG